MCTRYSDTFIKNPRYIIFFLLLFYRISHNINNYHTAAGVHNVDAKYEKNEVTVKGFIEAKKIQGRLQKWSKKNVDIISETKSKVEEKEKKV